MAGEAPNGQWQNGRGQGQDKQKELGEQTKTSKQLESNKKARGDYLPSALDAITAASARESMFAGFIPW